MVIVKLREESKSTFVDPYLGSLIYLEMGDEPVALQWLNRAYVVRSSFLIAISTEPKWKGMIDRPGLQAFFGEDDSAGAYASIEADKFYL